MLGVTGGDSTIAGELVRLIPPDEQVEVAHLETMRLDCDRYFIATGYLAGKSLLDIDPDEAADTMHLNFIGVARLCDRIIETNDRARIVVMGSESGYRGSYDQSYAGAKAALHSYVETRRLRTADQLLCGIAPHIVIDTHMTQRRSDLAEVMARGAATRIGRWITAREVAGVARWLLYEAPIFTCNTILRICGGSA